MGGYANLNPTSAAAYNRKLIQLQILWFWAVKVVLNLGAEKHGKCTGFPRPGTNGTQLQLIRSCTFLLDPGVPISGSECGVSSEPDRFSDARMCVKEQVGIRWV